VEKKLNAVYPLLFSENSETIGFVASCLFASAIDVSELHDWCVYVIGQNDVGSIPSYLLDLMDFDQPLAHLYKVIGFVPVWNHTDDEANALYGIAIQRGRELFDPPISKQSALASLKRSSAIVERFRRTFPFIKYSWLDHD
jgi:hypothetical protein